MAGCSDRSVQAAQGSGSCKSRKSHAGDASNEEVRHREAEARARWIATRVLVMAMSIRSNSRGRVRCRRAALITIGVVAASLAQMPMRGFEGPSTALRAGPSTALRAGQAAPASALRRVTLYAAGGPEL